MLARLDRIEGLDRAEVDHSGELLRLASARPEAFAAVRAAMRELGYDVTEETMAPPDARWYGSATARDLSREEAGVIAQRIVPPFAGAHGLAPGDADRLRDIVANALYRVFSSHALTQEAAPGALREESLGAVMEEAAPLIGQEAAGALAAALRQDLDRAVSPER